MLKMALNIAVAGAFALIVAVFGVFLWQTLFAAEEYGNGQPKTKPAYSEQQTSGENAPRTSPPPSSTKSTDDAIANYTKWLAIFTMFLVLATIGLFISGERSVQVARINALAARESADVAKTALISAQRAFLYINLFEQSVINQEFRILPQWKNSGSTPANQLTMWANWKTFPGEIPSDFTYPDLGPGGAPAVKKDRNAWYLGPQSTSYAEILKIPITAMEEVRVGKLRLFVWGWVEYRDIFEGTPLHRSEFCNEVVVTDMGRKDDQVSVAVSFYKYGPFNKAD
jgi:hypothetical protein